jgi:hypothetical protein
MVAAAMEESKDEEQEVTSTHEEEWKSIRSGNPGGYNQLA